MKEIKKPIIQIGFDKRGMMVTNINREKIATLNEINMEFLLNHVTELEDKILESEGSVKAVQDRVIEDFNKDTGSDAIKLSYNEFNDINRLMREGMLLNALKVFKGASGLGLKESKDFIDWYKKNMKKYKV